MPVALSADDYVELLPATWRAVNAYGIKIRHRTYDAEDLNPLRRQRSGVTEQKDLWEVHYDPYDVSRVWVRDHHHGGWITAFWKHLHRVAAPFGELAWDHARRGMPDGSEAEIADAVDALLTRANRGPEAGAGLARPSRRDRRVTARTRATAPQPSPSQPVEPPEPEPIETDEDAGPIAKVIPLGVFDPYQEAKKRW